VSPVSFNHAPDMLRGAVPSERRQRDEGVAMSVTWIEIIGIVGPAILIFMLDNSVWHKWPLPPYPGEGSRKNTKSREIPALLFVEAYRSCATR